MSEWVAVCADENEEPVEIPTESDGTLLLTSVTAQFPGSTGLKYRNPETNTLRGVRMQEGIMLPPSEEGWGMYTYICVRASKKGKSDEPRLKRKTDSDVDMYSKNIKVDDSDDDEDKTIDLIILGLPWKTTEDDIKEYFEPFGEVMMVQLKKRQDSGESKGFGFIRFAEKEVEKKVLLQRHMIDGRWCDIKVPDSQERKEGGGRDKSSCKIFVGRITEALTKEDLRDHFEAFGQVTDVYIPSPFRHFAFVQFSENKTAQSLLGKEHIIKGVSVKIGEAAPKGREGGQGGGMGGHPQQNGGNRFGGFGSPMDGGPRGHAQQQQGAYGGYGAYGYGAGGPSWGQPPLPGQYSGMGGSSSYGGNSGYGASAGYGGGFGGPSQAQGQGYGRQGSQQSGWKQDRRY